MEIVFFFLKPISENLVCEVNNSNKFIQNATDIHLKLPKNII